MANLHTKSLCTYACEVARFHSLSQESLGQNLPGKLAKYWVE